MLKYLILDVDGTLTDGGIYYDDQGNELKKFCSKDGIGLLCAKAAGIKLAVLTGRECQATTRRMKELRIDYVIQGIQDKANYLKSWILINNIEKKDIGYIGDDINDLAPMELCSYIACPSDACDEVKMIANYISNISGGHGAVRDCIEHYLKSQNLWDEMIRKCYGNAEV